MKPIPPYRDTRAPGIRRPGLLPTLCLLLLPLLATWPGRGMAESAAAPIPLAELGQRADAQQAAPAPVLAGGRATLAVPLQALRAEIGPAGLSLDSTSASEGTGRLQLTPSALSKGAAPTPVGPGRVALRGATAVLDRGPLTEVFSASADGLRQDFVVTQAPAGDGPLTLTLALDGATAAEAAEGIAGVALTLPGGRRLVYRRLHVTDAAGRVLTAHLRRVDDRTLTITVADAQARYPITIDPTISDADWQVLNPGLPGADAAVNALAYDGNGKLYVGGNFTAIGTVAANYVAQWNGSAWSALGSGLDNLVNALAVSSGGTLYAGGFFTTAGGVTANYIAQWNGGAWSALGSGLNGAVNALAVSSGGTLYAGGDFTTAGGVAVNCIAHWNGAAWSALGSGMDGSVYALAVSSGGTLYAGGVFTTADGVAASYIAQWDGAAWSALGSGMDSPVVALAVSSGGTLYAGGYFTALQGGTPGTLNSIAQWNAGAWSALGSGLDGAVLALAVSGGTLYAGGDFTAPAGGTAGTLNHIAHWDGAAWSALGSGLDSAVLALAVSGGSLYAGGTFTTAGAVPANAIAQWSGAAWSALGSGMNGPVYALAVSGSTIYAGGTFTTAGGGVAKYIAHWNGSAWSALGGGMDDRVNALAVSGGTLYAGGLFTTAGGVAANRIARWDGAAWSALGAGTDGPVYALAVSGGTLYAGGNFNTAGGSPASNIAHWDGAAWSALGSGLDTAVFALAVSGGTLYAGGGFNTAGGVTVNFIAHWNGAAWSALGTGMDAPVNALAVSGGTLYAGGTFITAGGVAASNIAHWDGAVWSALGSGLDNGVYALAVSGGTLYAGGLFTTAGGVAANHIAQWDGAAWSALGSGLDREVFALAVAGTKLAVGGIFLTAGNQFSPYAAAVRLPPCGPGIGLTTSPTALWQQLALPCAPSAIPADVVGVFGNSPTANLIGADYGTTWLIYDLPLSANAYRALTKTSLPSLGTGYWIKSLAAPVGGLLTVAGTATPVTTGLPGCQSSDGCAVVPVYSSGQSTGYKLIGNPFPYDIDWSQVRVRVNGLDLYTPSAANTAGLVSNQLWIWNGTSYQYWSDTAPNQGNLQYFKAFWIKVLPGAAGKTIELLIPAVPSTLQLGARPARPWYLAWLDALIPSAAAAELPAGAWVVQLKVTAPTTGWKAEARLGQWPEAVTGYDAADLGALAPFASPYLTLVFPQPGWGGRKGDYGTDFRPAGGWPDTWNLELRTDSVGPAVVLRWVGDRAILARSRLTDRQTGRVIDPTDPAYADGYRLTLTTRVRPLTWEYLGQ